MEFQYRNNNNKLEKINLVIGTEWKNNKIPNKYLNTIFNAVDSNKDGVLQEHEYLQLQNLFGIADTLEKQDKILTDIELKGLLNKIDDKEIDMSQLHSDSLIKIDKDEFDINNLEKRYPKTMYNYSINNFTNEIIISDKSTQKKAISVCRDNKGFYVTQYNKNGDEEYFYNFSSNGVLKFYDTKLKNNQSIRQYPLVDAIYKDITARNKFGLPTTGRDLSKHVLYLNKDNIISLSEEYKKKYGEDIVDAINGEIGLDSNTKKTLINHLRKCYEDVYGYKRDFINNSSRSKSKWHNGDIYSIENKNGILVIKNKNNGKTRTINLAKLVENLSLRAQGAVKAQITRLPGEVLMDLAVEVTSFKSATKLDRYFIDHALAFYHPLTDNITLGVGDTFDISDSLVHELGHAVDFTGNVLKRAKGSTSDKYDKFKNAFEKELAAYISQGGAVYDESKLDSEVFGNTYIRDEGGSNISIYCTKNIHECFAECYKFLTTGNCESSDVLEDFFPNTIRAADEMLKYVRSLDDNQRHCK